MNRDDRAIEKSLKGFLKLLAEDTTPNVPAVTQKPTPNVPPPGRPGSIDPNRALIQQGETETSNINFLSTLTMFTSKNPPDSNAWTYEEDRPEYLPLKDGRILKTITKKFPEFKIKSASAARYSDNQFRIILEGLLRAPAKIKITGITRGAQEEQKYERVKGTVEAFLDYIRIDNKAELSPQGELDMLEAFKKKSKLKIKGIDLTDLTVWTGITPPEEEVTLKEKEPEEEREGEKPEQEKESREGSELNDVVSDIMQAYLYKKRMTAKEKKEAKDVALNAAKSVVKDKDLDIKNLTQKDKDEILRAAAKYMPAATAAIQGGKRAQQNADIDFSSYFRMLLEAQNVTELESGRGGEILSHLNDHLYEEWFPGIAAPTNERVFAGNIYEWFAANSAMFKAEKRTVNKVREKSSIDITLEGLIVMEVEIWVDARLMGTTIRDQWKFYMLSGGKGKQVATDAYKTPGTLKRIGRSKPNLQQQASVRPAS